MNFSQLPWPLHGLFCLIGLIVVLLNLQLWRKPAALNRNSWVYSCFLFHARWMAWRRRKPDDFDELTDKQIAYFGIAGVIGGILIYALGFVNLLQ